MAGRLRIGAVFPPAGEARDKRPWVWRLWITGTSTSREGRAKTELAAKSACIAAWRDFLAAAELQEVEG
ncbi:hypothetical protein [Gemmobacter denitrificans]|uniref:Uncharacterized protein n=1 Tax=Gemmobacter denitrificans TaxID=3123040 RepID=A0ABU8BRF9_9RHOB